MPISIAISIRPSCNNLRIDVRIFMKFDIGDFTKNLSIYYNFCYSRIAVTGTLCEDLYAFLRHLKHNSLNIYQSKKCFEQM